jgi:lipopolysaccharide/colanic/teichoic acid biosynthesis glycosyltransferase
MLRLLDFILAGLGLIICMPLFLLLFIISYIDTGSPLFVQTRVGRYQKPFRMLKFRTMRKNTADVPTHDADASAITPSGRFLRQTKLDELPQLWNVLKGEMSLVGPRPSLLSQTELISEREARGVFSARPGLTGLAQIEGVDMSKPERLAETDARMLREMGVAIYFKTILKSIAGAGGGDRIKTY